MFTALNKGETPSRRPERGSKGTFSKIQQEIGCFQNGPKSTKSMDYSPWSGVDFGPFWTAPKFHVYGVK